MYSAADPESSSSAAAPDIGSWAVTGGCIALGAGAGAGTPLTQVKGCEGGVTMLVDTRAHRLMTPQHTLSQFVTCHSLVVEASYPAFWNKGAKAQHEGFPCDSST